MKNFIQAGDVIEVTAAVAVTSGQAYSVGQIFGVCVADAGIGELVQLKTSGVFDLTKVSAQAWSVGDAIYYDDLSGEVTNVANGLQVGVAVAAATNPTAVGRVRLGQMMQPTYASY